MAPTIISQRAFEEAKSWIPGGVNSPVRAFGSVGGVPPFIERGEGCRVWDMDGNGYIDFVCSWGPLILGHSHPHVKGAVARALEGGTSFGAPTWREVELARKICEMVPSMEMVRLVNSGTEATMSAIRLARGYTGRKKIVKFDGCYHGHADSFLVKAGSGVATLGIPGTPGVPEEIVSNTLAIPFNHPEAVELLFEEQGQEIAAVIVEPVPANMGVVPPRPGFLELLREVTRRHGALLIFDEVITGFRLGPGGAQERFGIQPDLTCLGKIIGGGLPVGAYGGRREVMEQIAPVGPVYQAGTLSGNPLATAAGLATLEVLSRPGIYDHLEEKAVELERGLKEAAAAAGVPCCTQRVGSMMTTFFGQEGPVEEFAQAASSDTAMYGRFFHSMLRQGVYLAPSQFEAMFVSLAHGDGDIAATVEAAERAFRELRG